MSKNNKSKCDFKCTTCEYYDKVIDYCKEKQIENCSKKPQTDFSTCKEYLINSRLTMF